MEFDPKEFTEDFDLKRFRAGEQAVNMAALALRTFKEIDQFGQIHSNENGCMLGASMVGSEWFKMRPAPAVDGWIEVKGGKCPEAAKGWKAGEWEIKFEDGDIRVERNYPTSLYSHTDWEADEDPHCNIVAIRRLPSTHVDPVNTSAERVEENDKGAIEKLLEYEREKLKPYQENVVNNPKYRPISQNEIMRIAGQALNDMTRQRIDVDRETVAALQRSF